ncbi:MAG: radical SAM/SPASM domain-containing protein [Candidatus Woesearchaeota archaeon]
MTNNCNLECGHCSQDAGPGKKSMSLDDIKTVVDNLPRYTHEIMITGGEVFTRKRLLYATLEYVNETLPNLDWLRVQTNGFWATDREKVNRTLDELVDLGVTDIDVAANDAYHRMEGLDMRRPYLLGKIAEERDMGSKRSYIRHLRVFPAGRGWSLESKRWRSFTGAPHCPEIKESISIDYEGYVYPCSIMLPGTELGNAKEEKVYLIMQRAMKNEKMTLLREKDGPRRLARQAGLSPKEIKDVQAYQKASRCGLCSYLFNEGLVQLNK